MNQLGRDRTCVCCGTADTAGDGSGGDDSAGIAGDIASDGAGVDGAGIGAYNTSDGSGSEGAGVVHRVGDELTNIVGGRSGCRG